MINQTVPPSVYLAILVFVSESQSETDTAPTSAMISQAVNSPVVGEALRQLVADEFLTVYAPNLAYSVTFAGLYFIELKAEQNQPLKLDPAKIKDAQDSLAYALRRMSFPEVEPLPTLWESEKVENPYIYGRFRSDVYKGFNIIVKTDPKTYYSNPAVSIVPRDLSPVAEIYFPDGDFMQWVSQPGDMAQCLKGAKAAVDEYLAPHEPQPSPEVIRRAMYGNYID